MFRRSRLLVHLLSLGLLIAQLGMAAHAYSHLDSDSAGLPDRVQTCVQCLSFTPLLGMVGSASCASLPHHAQNHPLPSLALRSFTGTQAHPAFRSRAPPYVL